MSIPAGELGPVLDQLSGADLYRGNAFATTGLPPGATPERIRRAREETLLALKAGVPPPASAGRCPQATDDGAGGTGNDSGAATIQLAFETMRDPVARLTHELLWPWPSADPGRPPVLAEHERAVRTHREAVEREYAGPYESGSPEARALDEMWEQGLAAWASVLSARAFWDHAKQRVAEIGDPRLTSGTVRRLRESLPRHIASVSAGLARRAVREGPGPRAADRLVGLLRRSPLPDEAVDDALRATVRPDERAIRAACTAARAAAEADGETAGEAGRTLLRDTEEPLSVIRTLLGPEAALADALSEETALALNACQVAHHDADGDVETVLELLGRAAELAQDRGTREVIARNKTVVEEGAGLSVPTGPADHLFPEVKELCERGKVERAAGLLRAISYEIGDLEIKKELSRIAADRHSLAGPVSRQPLRASFLGCGLRLTRRGEPNARGVFYAIHALTVLFLPVLPLAAYLADRERAYVKVPLTGGARWWRRCVGAALLALPVGLVFGPLGAAPAWGGLLLAYCYARNQFNEARVQTWAQSR